MELFTIGQEVNIKRSDGRIHPVVITAKNRELNTVTAEWTEGPHVKGKEVSVSTILSVNVHLLEKTNIVQSEVQPVKSLPSSKKLTAAPKVIKAAPMPYTRVTNQGTPKQLEANKSAITYRKPGASTSYTDHVRIADFRAAADKVVAKNLIASNASASKKLPAPKASTLTSTGIAGTGGHMITPGPSSVRNISPFGPGATTSRLSSANISMGTPPQQFPSMRCSSVVREVERMKENRERRRAWQSEQRKEKSALMNRDPGNPNWEVALMVRQYREQLVMKPLRSLSPRPLCVQQITVCVRKRPLNRREMNAKNVDIISIPNRDSLIVHELRHKVDLTKFLEHHKFRFDYTFDEDCSNTLVYECTARPLIQTMFEGGNATCFAYGQTGAGKTHTMGGEFYGKQQDCSTGIYAMATRDVFAELASPSYRELGAKITCSYFEIYGSKVYDLLAPGKPLLRVLEDGRQQVQVVGLTEMPVSDVQDVLHLIELGNRERTSGQTSANAKSSRSHAVFQIGLHKPDMWGTFGKCSFVDLAGNERGADTNSADRQTRIEGAEINKSLLALKECIRALSRQSSHLPFRGSKLTQVLRDSFIGGEHNKTCMIAMISPGLTSVEHTLNTLRYADRVKELVAKNDDGTEDEEQEEVTQVQEPVEKLDEDVELDDEMENLANESEPDLEMNTNSSYSQFAIGDGASHEELSGPQRCSSRAGEMSPQVQYFELSPTSEFNSVENMTEQQQSEVSLFKRSSNLDISESYTSPYVLTGSNPGERINLCDVIEQHKQFNKFLEQFLKNFNELETQTLENNPNFLKYLHDADQNFHELKTIANVTRDLVVTYNAQRVMENLLNGNGNGSGKAKNSDDDNETNTIDTDNSLVLDAHI
ncbi:kinesin-like protein Klp59C [Scaptodrosophila lebanonensis]|uniref:Kinesin-like protein Klp59C n=1 Tax=Drosophila lebanonensis TaxID=7225 RepID=A0A6J2TXY5_DROLE|nr:kinesin-like protein Klp59C [Scaptodrosophila lebanonensis]XP_030379757.1 kinesin-like protein Klp59C [Scaptodrosophila lebanonensis]